MVIRTLRDMRPTCTNFIGLNGCFDQFSVGVRLHIYGIENIVWCVVYRLCCMLSSILTYNYI